MKTLELVNKISLLIIIIFSLHILMRTIRDFTPMYLFEVYTNDIEIYDYVGTFTEIEDIRYELIESLTGGSYNFYYGRI